MPNYHDRFNIILNKINLKELKVNYKASIINN